MDISVQRIAGALALHTAGVLGRLRGKVGHHANARPLLQHVDDAQAAGNGDGRSKFSPRMPLS